MNLLLGIFLSYLIGSFPTGYLVAKIVRGIDVRTVGSGNVGATNVFRTVGRGWGMGVLVVDILKGMIPVSFLATSFSTGLLLGLAAIAGHAWTPWFRFRGGKGVATSIGVFLALAPKALGAALGVWAVVFAWKRYVSLASLALAVAFPISVFTFYQGAEFFSLLFPISLALAVFIFYTHRENIRRLREGQEKRLI